jgi:ectoine hydroxylase-related dioxygenase (phytanoyl-CoA dioxygenase family)
MHALSETQQRAFDRDGVICLRGALSAHEVARLARSIDRAVAQIGSTPTGYDITAVADAVWLSEGAHIETAGALQYNLDAFATYVRATNATLLRDPASSDRAKGRFLVETGTWTRCADLRGVATTSGLPRIAGELLDARTIRFYDDQIFVKEPGTTDRTAFHQDLGYFHIEGDQGCVMWVPVDAANRTSGALGYVRGSHRWGKTFKPNAFMTRLTMPNAEGEELPDIDNNEGDYNIVYFNVEPGDVVIHHFRTVHGSHGNASTTRTRRAASLRYVGEQVRYRVRPGAPAQPHRPLDWADGTELRDPWFPLVWRRNQAVAAE